MLYAPGFRQAAVAMYPAKAGHMLSRLRTQKLALPINISLSQFGYPSPNRLTGKPYFIQASHA